MNQLQAYWELGRFNKPIGTALLWYPTAWALWFANHGMPSLSLLILFFLGTLIMRGAGCVMNDIADRNIDKHVARTRFRPLTAGFLNIYQAVAYLCLLLLLAFFILKQLPIACFPWAVASVVITCIYPFCKRFLHAPQLVLGLAFSMGIPMAYAASNAPFDAQFALLFVINFIWILAYDTMYAMADRDDDLRIGVKSTAIYFASLDRVVISLLQISLHALWWLWAIMYQADTGFYIAWGMATLVLLCQQTLIRSREPDACLQAFKISSYYGLLLWVGVILS